MIKLGEASYYENRRELVYSQFDVYRIAIDKEPRCAVKLAKEWMQTTEDFQDPDRDNWQFCHKTEAMCVLAFEGVGRLLAQLPTSDGDDDEEFRRFVRDDEELNSAVQVFANIMLDPESNRLNEEAEYQCCENNIPLILLHKLLVFLLELEVTARPENSGSDNDDDGDDEVHPATLPQ